MKHGRSPVSGSSWQPSAQRGEELGCGLHSLLLGGARRFSGHLSKSGQYELWLSLETWVRTQHRGVATVVGRSAFQTKKQSHGAWLPCNLPELTSLCPWCWFFEYIICKPENQYYRSTFYPEQRVRSVYDWSQAQGIGWISWSFEVTITRRRK